MITILYHRVISRMSPESFDRYFQEIPLSIRKRISGFRNWQDAQRSLVGNILLTLGLKALNQTQYSLNDLKFTKYKRPYLDDSLDFNISHSGEFTICAISKEERVGVDIEEIKHTYIAEFESHFSDNEWKNIIHAADSVSAFYMYWVKKEAFLKAIGTGLFVPLRAVDVSSEQVEWNKQKWFFHELKLDDQYMSYVSSNHLNVQIEIERIELE